MLDGKKKKEKKQEQNSNEKRKSKENTWESVCKLLVQVILSAVD